MSAFLVYTLLALALVIPVLGAIVIRLLGERLSEVQVAASTIALVTIAIAGTLTLAFSDVRSLGIGNLNLFRPVASSTGSMPIVPAPDVSSPESITTEDEGDEGDEDEEDEADEGEEPTATRTPRPSATPDEDEDEEEEEPTATRTPRPSATPDEDEDEEEEEPTATRTPRPSATPDDDAEDEEDEADEEDEEPTATRTPRPSATPDEDDEDEADEEDEDEEPTATRTPRPSATPTPTDTPTATPTATATATATATPEPEPETEPLIYVVEPGDTLRGIAEEFDVTVEELLDANDLTPEEGDAIRPGQELIIPQ